MTNGTNQAPDYGSKDLADYQNLGRGSVNSYFRRVVANMKLPADAGTLRRLAAFTSTINNWRKWASHVMRYITSPKHPFLTYGTASGVYALDDKCEVAVAGDWGTGTDEAKCVTCAMKKDHNSDYTVHLGDVYYVGDLPELEENCLGQTLAGANGVKWKKGNERQFRAQWESRDVFVRRRLFRSVPPRTWTASQLFLSPKQILEDRRPRHRPLFERRSERPKFSEQD
jgi:hypothetical protein